MMETKGVSVVLLVLDWLRMNKQDEHEHDAARLGYFLVYKWNLHDAQAMNVFAAAILTSHR